VKYTPVAYGSALPDGGYDTARTPTSPSSPPALTGNATVVDDAAAATTTPDNTEPADADPAPFDAVTTTRNVDPTSPATTAYELAVAPTTSTHPPPDESHRRH
jgi:hypothetical protein